MQRHRWFAAAALMMLMAQRGFHAQGRQPAVMVVIHDSAAVPVEILASARRLATAVFETAGVVISWKGSEGNTRPCHTDGGSRFCTQVLLRPRNPQSEPGPRRIMGIALAADQRRAVLSLYFDAVSDVARRYGSPRGEVLGLALAHEMGHVLLPPPSHSATGIMQPSWEGDDIRHALDVGARFTTAQARR